MIFEIIYDKQINLVTKRFVETTILTDLILEKRTWRKCTGWCLRSCGTPACPVSGIRSNSKIHHGYLSPWLDPNQFFAFRAWTACKTIFSKTIGKCNHFNIYFFASIFHLQFGSGFRFRIAVKLN